jgi:putative hydrolase
MLATDFHVHTAFGAGRDSVGLMATAAERAGLREIVIADRANAATPWLGAYQSAIVRAQQRTDVRLRVGIEVEVVRLDGWLDMPGDLGGLERLSVSVSRLPLPGGLSGVDEVRTALRTGLLTSADVVDMLIAATTAGLERASRYAPTQLARPLNLLRQVGLDVDELDGTHLTALSAACGVTGSVVELSEAWRIPSAGFARRLADAGVRLVAASDAGDVSRLGQWQYLRSVLPTPEQTTVR